MMSSLEARAKFKSHFLRLGERKDISSNDIYWETFWDTPKIASDFFEGLSNNDIRSVCQTRNFVKLLRIVSLRLISFANEPRDMQILPLLNCIRILTRLLPYFYENPIFNKAEHQIFWSLNSITKITKTSPQSTTATAGTIDSASTKSNQDHDNASIEAQMDFETRSDVKSDKVEVSLNDASPPLGAQLVNTAVNLLFTRGFTVESGDRASVNGVEFSIWEPGIGLVGAPAQIKPEIDSNRLEVMRFLTTLCSQCMYFPASNVVSKGSRYLSVLVSAVPRLHILTLLSSLLNLACRSSRTENNGLELGNSTLNHLRVLTVTTAIQLLTMMIVYPLPKDDIAFLEKTGLVTGNPYNSVRFYFGKLHKEQELKFIIQSLISYLQKPLVEVSENEQSSSLSSMIKSKTANIQPSIWGIESTMLLWELYQCNKRFKLQLINSYGNELAITLLYNVSTYRKNDVYQNFVRLCSYFFLLLTSDQILLLKILQPYSKLQYDKLPESFKITPIPITYRDFIVSKICQLLLSDDISIISPTLMECLFNLIPIAGLCEPQVENRRGSTDSIVNQGYKSPGGGLSYSTCNLICQLVVKFSAHRFLTEQPSNLDYLALLMRAIAQAICRFPKQSRNLIFTVTKNAKYFENINVTIENMAIEEESSDDEETVEPNEDGDDKQEDGPQYTPYGYHRNSETSNYDEEEIEVNDSLLRPKPPIGMSLKAKGKAPKYASLKRTWAGYTSFNIILNFIEIVRERLHEFDNLSKIDTVLLLNKIENLEMSEFIESIAKTDFLQSKSNLEQLKFVWTNLSLGWYESILWGSIFSNNETISRRFSKTISLNSTISTFSKVSSDWGFGKWSNSEADSIEIVNRSLVSTNIWYGTRIRLFKTDKFLILQKNNLSDQLIRRFSDFKIQSPPTSPTATTTTATTAATTTPPTGGPPRISRQNSVSSVNTVSNPSSPVIQKDEYFTSDIANSIKVTPRNSMHRLSVSSNFNSPRNLTRNNSTVSTPIVGSPRNSISL